MEIREPDICPSVCSMQVRAPGGASQLSPHCPAPPFLYGGTAGNRRGGRVVEVELLKKQIREKKVFIFSGVIQVSSANLSVSGQSVALIWLSWCPFHNPEIEGVCFSRVLLCLPLPRCCWLRSPRGWARLFCCCTVPPFSPLLP